MTTKKHASTHHSADAEPADAAMEQSQTKPGSDDVVMALTQGGRPAPAPGGGGISVQISSTVQTTLTDFEIWRNKEHH